MSICKIEYFGWVLQSWYRNPVGKKKKKLTAQKRMVSRPNMNNLVPSLFYGNAGAPKTYSRERKDVNQTYSRKAPLLDFADLFSNCNPLHAEETLIHEVLNHSFIVLFFLYLLTLNQRIYNSISTSSEAPKIYKLSSCFKELILSF